MANLPPGIQVVAARNLAAVIDALNTPQADYMAANGRYWQSAASHDEMPRNGNMEPPNPTPTGSIPRARLRTNPCGDCSSQAAA